MKIRLLVALVSFSFFSGRLATASEEVHIFYGSVQSVDLAAKTFSIKSNGRTLVIHYDEKTKVSSFSGHVSWDKVTTGQGATVTMRLGEGNKGLAVMVRFDPYAAADKALSLFVARLTDGQTVSGLAVFNYVAYEPPGERIARAIGFGSNSGGVFVLSVNPDGSVSRITAAKSLNSSEANERAGHWLRQWRFKPKSVIQVQVPVGMSRVGR